jgi:hypothetical protein
MRSDIAWPDAFPLSLNRILDEIMKSHARVKFVYPDYSESGYLSCSVGPHKSIILVKKSNSFGGGSISRQIPLQIVSSAKKEGRVYWDFARMEPILFVHSQ